MTLRLTAALLAILAVAAPADARRVSQSASGVFIVVDDRSDCVDHYVETVEKLTSAPRFDEFVKKEYPGRRMMFTMRILSLAKEQKDAHHWGIVQRLSEGRPLLCADQGAFMRLHFFQDGSHWGGYPLTVTPTADNLETLIKDVFARKIKL